MLFVPKLGWIESPKKPPSQTLPPTSLERSTTLFFCVTFSSLSNQKILPSLCPTTILFWLGTILKLSGVSKFIFVKAGSYGLEVIPKPENAVSVALSKEVTVVSPDPKKSGPKPKAVILSTIITSLLYLFSENFIVFY